MPFIQRPNGVRLHTQVTGRSDAAPVLLIQGLGMNKNGWILQRFAMATKFHTITFDNRGAGRSTIPGRPFTLHDMADDAIAGSITRPVDDCKSVDRASSKIFVSG